MPYEGYERKRPKHIPIDSYLYLARHTENCMTRNSRGPVRTHNTSTQNISNSKMSTQKISNPRVCSTDESE